jgi:predicted transcriptional regulator
MAERGSKRRFGTQEIKMTINDKKTERPDPQACAGYLKALADSNRLRIVHALQEGQLSVSDLSLLLEMEVVKVSHHLRVMYHARLVTTEREGKYIYYKLNTLFCRGQKSVSSLDFGCCKIEMRN